jgi:hypothetical protein
VVRSNNGLVQLWFVRRLHYGKRSGFYNTAPHQSLIHFHYMYSSALVKVLWDIGNRISTPVLSCPVSSSTSQLSTGITKLFIQNRLSASWRKPSRIEKSGS